VHISITFIFDHLLSCFIVKENDKDEDNETQLLDLKNSSRRYFLALGSNGKTILGPTEEKIWTTLV
jgi:hypothetical protein